MTDLSSLIERLEKATEGSRELDGEIWCAANGYEFLVWDGAGVRYRVRETGWYAAEHVKPYTASLDCALTLVPEGWQWRAWHTPTDEGSLWGAEVNWEPPGNVYAETPALALCIAALRARQAREGRE